MIKNFDFLLHTVVECGIEYITDLKHLRRLYLKSVLKEKEI